jgi:ABC-type phosphate/phosphonate transport system substrate-binding protein
LYFLVFVIAGLLFIDTSDRRGRGGVLLFVKAQEMNTSSSSLEDGWGGVCATVRDFDITRHRKQLYRVGVLAIRGFEAAIAEFNTTFTDYLSMTAGRRFDPPIAFEMKPLNFNSLFTDVEESIVDFIYVNPSAFSCIESEYTARSLVSQISRRTVGGQVYHLSKFGGVIAVRADRDDINSIYDLKDKMIAAASISGLGSGQMQFLEMQRAGMSYINDPKQLVFTSNQGKVVNGVLSGQFDVGFIRTDQIERTKDAQTGQLVNVSDFKIIEPRKNYIDGVEFPFIGSTPLYAEWNVAALDHVPEDVAREVQTALLAIADHANIGNAIQNCYETHNNTYCDTDVSFPYGFVDDNSDFSPRCDTNIEIALTAVEAMDKGKYSGWQTTLSYMQLRSMQEGTGFITQDGDTNIWRCIRSVEMYDSITCPVGYNKKDKKSVDQGCSNRGLPCPEGSQCVCQPCTKIEVCYDGVEINGNCVSYGVFLPAILVPLFLISFLLVHWYVVYKRKMADAVWEVNPKDLKFDDPPVVIGVGTFGTKQGIDF